jgi:hypothetical protein
MSRCLVQYDLQLALDIVFFCFGALFTSNWGLGWLCLSAEHVLHVFKVTGGLAPGWVLVLNL